MNLKTISKNDNNRIEPIYISPEGTELIPELVEDCFRIILFLEGNIIGNINGMAVDTISPAILCLNETDRIVLEGPIPKNRTLYFSPEFLNKFLNFSNIRVEDTDDYDVGQNSMLLESFILNNKYGYYRTVTLNETVRFALLMKNIAIQLDDQPDGWWACRSRSYLSEMLFVIAQIFERDNNQKENKFNEIFDYIKDNYPSKITLDSLCKKFSTNRTYMNELFKRETGKTPLNYIIDFRLQIAHSFIMNTDFSVAEIADKTGFSDSTHLERLFKKKFGKNPLEIRKE